MAARKKTRRLTALEKAKLRIAALEREVEGRKKTCEEFFDDLSAARQKLRDQEKESAAAIAAVKSAAKDLTEILDESLDRLHEIGGTARRANNEFLAMLCEEVVTRLARESHDARLPDVETIKVTDAGEYCVARKAS